MKVAPELRNRARSPQDDGDDRGGGTGRHWEPATTRRQQQQQQQQQQQHSSLSEGNFSSEFDDLSFEEIRLNSKSPMARNRVGNAAEASHSPGVRSRLGPFGSPDRSVEAPSGEDSGDPMSANRPGLPLSGRRVNRRASMETKSRKRQLRNLLHLSKNFTNPKRNQRLLTSQFDTKNLVNLLRETLTALLREGFQELAEPLHVNPIGGAVEGWKLRSDCNHIFAAAIKAIVFADQDDQAVQPDLRKMSRGNVGETVLHQVLLLKPSSDTPQYNDIIARYLIENHQELIDITYSSSAYWGEVALHICVVNNDLYLFNDLLNARADCVTPRACGEFFLPFPQATSMAPGSMHREHHPVYGTDDQHVLENFKDNPQYVYYGEYVHSFCACSKQVAMLDKCLEHNANINAQDTLGNTALHVVIMLSHRYKCDTSKVMAPVLMKRGARIDIANHEGYTPLLLCAHYGNVEVFDILLQAYRDTQWVYGHTGLFTYKLKWLDSTAAQYEATAAGCMCVKHSNRSKAKSVLSEAVHYDHIHLLQNSVLHRIVEEKWKAYGRKHAVVEAAAAAMHLILITASIGLRPTTGGISTIMMYNSYATEEEARHNYGRAVCDFFVLGFTLYMSYNEVMGWYTYGKGYWQETRTTSETAVTVLFIASVLVVALLRLGGAVVYTGIEDEEYLTLVMWDLFFFCMACITGWMYILFSTLRVLSFVGPLVVTVEYILSKEISRFLIVYIIMLAGFFQAFYVIYTTDNLYYLWRNNDTLPASGQGFTDGYGSAFINTLLASFVTDPQSLGYDITTASGSSLRIISLIIYTLFLFFGSTLMLNLIIAMFNESYIWIQQNAHDRWYLQRARKILYAENFPANRRAWLKYLQYQSQLNSGAQDFMQIETSRADGKLDSSDFALISLEDVKLATREPVMSAPSSRASGRLPRQSE